MTFWLLGASNGGRYYILTRKPKWQRGYWRNPWNPWSPGDTAVSRRFAQSLCVECDTELPESGGFVEIQAELRFVACRKPARAQGQKARKEVVAE